MKKENVLMLSGVVVLMGIVVAAIAGWIINLVAVVRTVDLPVTGMFVMRAIGVFVAPLGSFLGLFF